MLNMDAKTDFYGVGILFLSNDVFGASRTTPLTSDAIDILFERSPEIAVMKQDVAAARALVKEANAP